MAKFTPLAENFRSLPHYNTISRGPVFNTSVLKLHLLHSPPSRSRLNFRVLCIKEKETAPKKERVAGVLTGLRVNELEQLSSEGETGLQSGSGEEGFDWKSLPWKNIPDRYKLIGTTSLAFVICNMDKVVSFSFIFSLINLSK